MGKNAYKIKRVLYYTEIPKWIYSCLTNSLIFIYSYINIKVIEINICSNLNKTLNFWK